MNSLKNLAIGLAVLGPITVGILLVPWIGVIVIAVAFCWIIGATIRGIYGT